MGMQSKNTASIEDKRAEEKEVASKMIAIYCRGHKHTTAGLCQDCQGLLDYARQRVDRCPFMETKTFCSTCRVHCYEQSMRTRIREVMRYSGPWMLLYHPILTIRHLIEEQRAKKRQTERGTMP